MLTREDALARNMVTRHDISAEHWEFEFNSDYYRETVNEAYDGFGELAKDLMVQLDNMKIEFSVMMTDYTNCSVALSASVTHAELLNRHIILLKRMLETK